MKSTSQTITLLLTATAVLTGCRNMLPCPDCDDQAEAVDLPHEDEAPLPDLPCGGADFMTDSHNCGSCGNECPLWYEGTDWEAGTCVQGECGPRWTTCTSGEGIFNTCGELCSSGGLTCFAGGCSGFTALLTRVGFDGNCRPIPPDRTMTGSCDEPIPWEHTIEWDLHVKCCCG